MSLPTDDVKALIDEARSRVRREREYAATVKALNVAVDAMAIADLIDRLAAALSDADAAGFARGIEEAARVADAAYPGGIPDGPSDEALLDASAAIASSIRALLASQEQQT